METIVPAFTVFPKESQAVGYLLTSYGELEGTLCLCVGMVTGNFDTALKAMFRPRGETQRIDIADALARHKFGQSGLQGRFSEAIANMRHCLKIRNQYAHCQWHDVNTGKLAFVNLQEIAVRKSYVKDLGDLTIRYIDIPLLEQQAAYFYYVNECLNYLNFEARMRSGALAAHPFQCPKKVQQPPVYLP